MKVSIGRVVVVLGIQSNGHDRHPALVTFAWDGFDTIDGPVMTNLMALPDLGTPRSIGSVPVYDTPELAEAAQEAHKAAYEGIPPADRRSSYSPLIVAHWPERA